MTEMFPWRPPTERIDDTPRKPIVRYAYPGSGRSLEEELDFLRNRRADRQQRELLIQRYLENMSADSMGTPAGDLLSPEDAEICQAFIDQYRNLPHPFKRKLQLRGAKTGEKLWGKNTTNIYPGMRLGQGFFRKRFGSINRPVQIPLRTIWEGEGFLIGHVRGTTLAPSTGWEELYLCTDGMFRCSRQAGLFPDSYGVGVGTVPSILDLNVEIEETLGYTNVGEHESFTFPVHSRIARVLGDLAISMSRKGTT